MSNVMSGTSSYVVQADSIGSVTFTTPSGPAAVPAQVPPPPDGFTDREAELATLRELVERRSAERTRPPIVAVRGIVGVGKTALLRHAVASFASDFPDGALHVPCGPDGESPSEAAARLLFALGVPEACIPAGFARRVDLYRSLSAGRRTITVFDDVSDSAQVISLLPNSGTSLVLVAGNRVLEELHVDGAVDLLLRPLDVDNGVLLLAQACPDGRVDSEPEAARELVVLCDGLPLALRVAAARLAVRPQWMIRRLVGEITDSGVVLDELTSAGKPVVRRVFDLVYDDLPSQLQQLYRTFSLLVGAHFGAEVIAAMCDRPVAAVRRELDRLCETGMVEERPDGTYWLHRLVRAHALGKSAEKDDDEVRVTALRRAVQWWLFGAVAADVAVTGPQRLRTVDPRDVIGTEPIDMPRLAGLEWLDREHNNILGIMRSAAERGWHAEVWQLFEALFALYDARKPLSAWVRAGEMAVESAKLGGNMAAEARSRCLLARAMQELERYAEAHEHLDRARELAGECGERLLASTFDFTGNVHMHQGQYETALTWFQKALAINEKLDLRRGMAMQSMLVGRALGRLGRIDEALAALARARDLVAGTNSDSLVPKILVSTGRVLADAGRDSEAEVVLQEAIDMAVARGFTAVEADAIRLLGVLAERRGDAESTRRYRELAQAAYEKMGSPLAARVLVTFN